jgi:hypothetical protein
VSTSLQRTYRNLRVGIAGTVVLLGVSVGVAATHVGVLPSISAYYYTSARNVFVGSLIAAAIAILALSGRGLQRALLDAAALFAPLVALVPTPIRVGTVPGYEDACGVAPVCVPAEVIPDIDTGVATYLIVGALTVAISVAVTLVAGGGSFARSLPSLSIAAVVLLAVLVAWAFFHAAFVESAHLAAAAAFVGIVALVAVANAFDQSPTTMPRRWRRAVYWVIAASMTLDILVMVVVVAGGNDAGGAVPPVLIGEAVALLLFVAFWVVQSIEKRDDADPSIAAGPPTVSRQ